eukprot:15452918-Alexandrium_andersonii.AAC.1
MVDHRPQQVDFAGQGCRLSLADHVCTGTPWQSKQSEASEVGQPRPAQPSPAQPSPNQPSLGQLQPSPDQAQPNEIMAYALQVRLGRLGRPERSNRSEARQ